LPLPVISLVQTHTLTKLKPEKLEKKLNMMKLRERERRKREREEEGERERGAED
jgi:hypothetical protein